MMMNLKQLLCVLTICVLTTAISPAAMMNYGTFNADTVDFVDVTEDNLETGLHFTVTGTVGDVLLIDPVQFGARVDPGPGAGLIDSELEMMIVAKPGGSVDMISLDEEGDYTIVGEGEVEANVAYFWQILEVDHTPITPISGMGTDGFTTSDVGTGDLWQINIDVDLSASLADAGMSGTVTKAKFSFDNTLVATASNAESIAFIKKKQIGGVRVMVPEPTSIFSAVLGLLGMLGLRRR
jgi:hypothetical protein